MKIDSEKRLNRSKLKELLESIYQDHNSEEINLVFFSSNFPDFPLACRNEGRLIIRKSRLDCKYDTKYYRFPLSNDSESS